MKQMMRRPARIGINGRDVRGVASLRRVLAIAMAGLVLGVAPARGQQANPRDEGRATTNKSVSLSDQPLQTEDETGSVDPSPDENGELEGHVAERSSMAESDDRDVDSMPAIHGQAQDRAETGARDTSVRLAKRGTVGKGARQASESRSLRLDASDVAWYRTGLGSLAIVLALVAGVFWGVRRWVPAAREPARGVLRVLGRTNLTPKHHLSLVQLGQRLVLVGVSPDSVTAVSEITDRDEVADLVARSGKTSDTRREQRVFDEWLSKEYRSYHDEPGVEAAPPRVPQGHAGGARSAAATLLNRLRSLRTTDTTRKSVE